MINRELTHMLFAGENPDRAIAEIRKQLGISQYRVATVVLTENAPIFHPRCRGTTAPYFDDEGLPERFARDIETGEGYYMPAGSTYNDWKKQQEELYGKGSVDKKRLMHYNEKADTKQFEKYSARIGDDAPKTFKEFQNLKYGDKETYSDLVGYYRYKGKVPEATITDYKTSKTIKAIGVVGSIRIPPLPPQQVYILEDRASKKDPAHIFHRMAERKITVEDIQSYVDNALFSVTQFNGTRRVFYSVNGVAVLTQTKDYEGINWIAKTAWDKTDFDEIAEKSIKEVLKNGR